MLDGHPNLQGKYPAVTSRTGRSPVPTKTRRSSYGKARDAGGKSLAAVWMAGIDDDYSSASVEGDDVAAVLGKGAFVDRKPQNSAASVIKVRDLQALASGKGRHLLVESNT